MSLPITLLGPVDYAPTAAATSPWCRATAAGRSPTTAPARWWPTRWWTCARLGIYVKEYVFRLEHAVLRTLAGPGRHRPPRAPARRASMCGWTTPFRHAALTGPADRRDPFRGLGKIAALVRPERQAEVAGQDQRIPIKVVPAEVLKKPDWIRVKAGSPSTRFYEIKQILREHKLHTVCEEASCPNIGECFGKGTATFMIMGDKCTRRCPFCDVGHGRPDPLDADEPENLAQDHRRAQAQVRGHHQRRPRRPARRRRRPHFVDCIRRRANCRRPPDRGAGARLPRPRRPRAGAS
jgi:hypothetical protein